MLFAIRQAVDLVRRRFASLHTLTPPNIRKRTILRLEPLEGRCVPAAFTVTTLNGSGDGSLRTAIANADGSLDDSATISFAAGLSGTINLGSDLTTLGKNITISGPSSGIGITVNGGDSFHPFTVAAGKTCEIDNLDITHGLSVGGFGGAITNNGALALSGCQITWNHAQSGGGIANMQGAVLDLKNNTYVSNNTADNFGGGIYNFGSEVTIYSGCTINLNQAANGGGGIYTTALNSDTPADVTVGNGAHVDYNTVTQGIGGGIYCQGASGSSTVSMGVATLTGNRAESGPQGQGGFGGGLEIAGAGASVQLVGTTI